MGSVARRRVAAVSSYTVEFGMTPKPAKPASESRLPRVARLLALAHSIDRRIRDGELRDLAHAADVLGLTRARITQITNLLLLAPEIQEAILDLPPTTGRDLVTERQLRAIIAQSDWHRQRAQWRPIAPRLHSTDPEHRPAEEDPPRPIQQHAAGMAQQRRASP